MGYKNKGENNQIEFAIGLSTKDTIRDANKEIAKSIVEKLKNKPSFSSSLNFIIIGGISFKNYTR